MQTRHLDQRPDVWLRRAKHQRAATNAKPPREHGKVEHQRGVGERKLCKIYNNVGGGANRARQGTTPQSLRRPVLIAATEQRRAIFSELDDM